MEKGAACTRILLGWVFQYVMPLTKDDTIVSEVRFKRPKCCSGLRGVKNYCGTVLHDSKGEPVLYRTCCP